MKRFEPIEGEVILAEEPIHWKNYISSLCLLVACAVLLAIRASNPGGSLLDNITRDQQHIDTGGLFGKIEMVLMVCGVVFSYYRISKVIFIRYYVTTRRIIMTSGFFTIRTTEMFIQRCETVNIKQSIYERLFGCADITVLAPGSIIHFEDVSHAIHFKNAILTYLAYIRENTTDAVERQIREQ